MLLMFQRAETTEQKQKIIDKKWCENRTKKTPQLRGEKIVGLSTVNLARYPQRQLDILFYYGV